jgi:UDP:flavonoid glycosyltransferase YjiC (YdhE family)
MTASAARRRILFMAEGATLAHVARPLALAAALPPDRYDVTIVAPRHYGKWASAVGRWRPLQTVQPPERIARQARRGRLMFSHARLKAYAAEDAAHLRDVAPDVVVGDLRVSLASSARLAGAPYIAISNAYWSPDLPFRPPRPTLDLFQRWPAPAADFVYRLILKPTLRWQARPIDDMLTASGLPGVGRDLRRAYTEADICLYADFPQLFPMLTDTPRRRFLGPVAWEPPALLPDWWDELSGKEPIAYLTLGSSGDVSVLERLSNWLRKLGFKVMLATAGRASLQGDGKTLFVAKFLPGLQACERARLVVCNGGSPTTTQALIKGRPVLGIASNLDQFLNMQAVEAAGAGICLRADALRWRSLVAAVDRLWSPPARSAAASFAAAAVRLDPASALMAAIDELAPP